MGKNDPVRVLAIFTDRSPEVVETTFVRVPLRWVFLVSFCSCMPAPMCSVASASTSAWRMVCSNVRINAPSSAVRIASVNSSRADWFRVIAWSFFVSSLDGISQRLTRWPAHVGDQHGHHDQEPDLHHSVGLNRGGDLRYGEAA